MSKILEKTGGCWNKVDPESIGPEKTVSLYYLKQKGALFRNIPKHIWNKEVKNVNNLMLVEGGDSTKTMCFNEEVRDAMDVLCDILSHWNNFLLEKYNNGLLEDDRFENIKDLLNSSDETVWKRIEEKARDLGGVTRDEIFEMGTYKLARNRGVHKGKWLKKIIALEQLDIASVNMSPTCKRGLEKCIDIVNH